MPFPSTRVWKRMGGRIGRDRFGHVATEQFDGGATVILSDKLLCQEHVRSVFAAAGFKFFGCSSFGFHLGALGLVLGALSLGGFGFAGLVDAVGRKRGADGENEDEQKDEDERCRQRRLPPAPA